MANILIVGDSDGGVLAALLEALGHSTTISQELGGMDFDYIQHDDQCYTPAVQNCKRCGIKHHYSTGFCSARCDSLSKL